MNIIKQVVDPSHDEIYKEAENYLTKERKRIRKVNTIGLVILAVVYAALAYLVLGV